MRQTSIKPFFKFHFQRIFMIWECGHNKSFNNRLNILYKCNLKNYVSNIYHYVLRTKLHPLFTFSS